MKWRGREQSGNVEDRRGFGGGRMVAGGTIGTVVIGLLFWLLGGDPSRIINSLQTSGSQNGVADSATIKAEEESARFASVVLKDTEDIWHMIFHQNNRTYREPVLVLFSGSAESACGFSSAATGPFYCPGDERLYIDLTFWKSCSKNWVPTEILP